MLKCGYFFCSNTLELYNSVTYGYSHHKGAQREKGDNDSY